MKTWRLFSVCLLCASLLAAPSRAEVPEGLTEDAWTKILRQIEEAEEEPRAPMGILSGEQIKKLTASDGAADDWFGNSISIAGDTVVIGAELNSDAGFATGSAYVFERDQGGAGNWGEVKKLTASDGLAGDYFGCSVSVASNTAIVGAYYSYGNTNHSGSVYVFYRNQGGADNWGGGQETDRFGWGYERLLWLLCIRGGRHGGDRRPPRRRQWQCLRIGIRVLPRSGRIGQLGAGGEAHRLRRRGR
ncbi:MAG: FG-GAP repeat protein [Verrucomicrobia bacterium]|nr:FG-GAP repeat protein [Verrucomicrobiota bacterium]